MPVTEQTTQDHKSVDESKQSGPTNIQEQRKALLEQQRQKRFEREKQMGLLSGEVNTSLSDTPLKPAIGGSKSSKTVSAVKRVRFSDEEQVS